MTDLERKFIELCYHGKDRCGSGWGKYPTGVLYAVEVLRPLCQHADCEKAYQSFKERYDR